MEQEQVTTGIENLYDFITLNFPRPLHHTKVEDMLVYLATTLHTSYTLSKQDIISGELTPEGGILRRLTAEKYSGNLMPRFENSSLSYPLSGFWFERDISSRCPLDSFSRLRFCYPHIEQLSEMRPQEQENIRTVRKTIDTYFDQAD